MGEILYYAFPVFIALLFLERARVRRARREGRTHLRGYLGPDTRASIWMGVGNVLISAVLGSATFAV
jgi:hypothetical protein